MSRIRADRYTNREGTGAPTFSSGVNVVGISSVGITTITGIGQTALTVNGDARVTGVLTVGQGSVTIGSTNITTQQINNLNFPTAGALSNRNLIINGAMTVSQRSTSNTGQTATAYRACDRFFELISSLGTWTVEQSTDAPARFSNSLKLTCTTADASPSAPDAILVSQRIEAQNLQHLSYGTVNAATTIISFWVKSNKTGGASFDILEPDGGNRLFSQSYNINAADTWEYKTIEIPGDTAGNIDNDNGNGFSVEWWLNSGSTFTGGSHQTSWGALDQTARNASNLGVGGAVNDYLQITGVQLELGTRATPFEHRPIGTELALCQRYFQIIATGDQASICLAYTGSTSALGPAFLPVTMRTTPTLYDFTSGVIRYRLNSASANVNSGTAAVLNSTITSPTQAFLEFSFSGLVAGQSAHVRKQISTAIIGVDAEL